MRVDFSNNPEAERMVSAQLVPRGITDPHVVEAMKAIPRHLFISGKSRSFAYGDFPVAIGHDQTISQPYIVAYMTQALEFKGTERVLEIGTGSGYQTAVLAECAGEVYTVEVIEHLQKRSRLLLDALGFNNVHYLLGDGGLGWPEMAPFDRIVVTAAVPVVPRELKAQLMNNGIMVIPVGGPDEIQELQVMHRIGQTYQVEESIGCRFVPLVGKYMPKA